MADKKMDSKMEKKMESSIVPTGVKVISVLYYIGAGLLLLLGIIFLVSSGYISTVVEQVPLLAFLAPLAIGISIIFLILGVVYFFVGRGLWKGRNWARIVAIIFAAIGLISAFMGMVQGNIGGNILSLLLNAIIGGYLAFSKSVKASFA